MKATLGFRDDLIDKEVSKKLSEEVSSYIIEQVKHNMNNSTEEITMKPFNLEEYLTNPSREVVTRDGRNARIICTDAKNTYPIVALIERKNKDGEHLFTFLKDGRFVRDIESGEDLFFTPEKHEGWINVYRDTDTGTMSFGAVLYASKKEAEEVGKFDDYYVSTARIEWEE